MTENLMIYDDDGSSSGGHEADEKQCTYIQRHEQNYIASLN